jgi:hypothetical protein
MALYEPLRDTFRELNRLIIDRRQFDAQHELNRANQQLQNKMLEVRIADQQFQNSIAEEGLNIRRDAQKIRQDQANDAILSSKQARELIAYQLKEKKAAHTPREVNLRPLLGNDLDLATNPDLHADIENVFKDHFPGATFSASTGRVLQNGQPIKVTGYNMGTMYAPMLYDLRKKYTNTPAAAEREIANIDADLQGIKDQMAGQASEDAARVSPFLATLGNTNNPKLDDMHYLGRKSELDYKKNKLLARRAKLEERTTPMYRYSYESRKANYLESQANYWHTQGMPKLAENLRLSANQHYVNARSWLTTASKGGSGEVLTMKNVWDKDTGKWSRSIPWSNKSGWQSPLKPNEMSAKPATPDRTNYTQISRNVIADTVIRNKLILPGLPPQASAATEIERRYDIITAKKGKPTDQVQANLMAQQAMQTYKNDHNELAQAYRMLQERKRDLGKAKYAKLLAILRGRQRELNFSYMPTAPYSETIESLESQEAGE